MSKGRLSLSKPSCHDKGFDKLSPNGEKAGLRYLSPNGSLPARSRYLRCGSIVTR
jgi:hypothetical protein